MKPLKIGIGGVRGVVGETFTPELAVAFAQAFGTYLGPGTILVGRDTRASGPMVAAAVRAGLLDRVRGHRPGICPTPSLQLAVPWLEARGGISITAGPQRRRVERPQVRAAGRALPEWRCRRRNCWTSTIRASSRRPVRPHSHRHR